MTFSEFTQDILEQIMLAACTINDKYKHNYIKEIRSIQIECHFYRDSDGVLQWVNDDKAQKIVITIDTIKIP